MPSDDRQASTQAARIQAARGTYSGQGLTENQFREAWAITGIIHNEILKSGSFREKLTDYSHAFARAEKFDALRGESILRDLYQGRYSQSMNQTREGLLEVEQALPEDSETRALQKADTVGERIKDGPTQPFYKAYDTTSLELAKDLGVTQSYAKSIMKDAFQTKHGKSLYEEGKAFEEAYHRPVKEAEIASRKAEKLQERNQSYSRN
ncbi:hypothetical protein [Roseibium album]|uniref:hypothetical protein n=1 Tax=Roseibium album TaxID=311410 RepID=UPI003299BF63